MHVEDAKPGDSWPPDYRKRSMISVDDALAAVLVHTTPLDPESVVLFDAIGRALADDMSSGIDVPPYTKSMMDGFAIRADDIVAGPATQLAVVAEIRAGDVSTASVSKGQAARIMTGAPIPDGADAVVPIEETDPTGDLVTINVASVERGRNVLAKGSVLHQGQPIFRRGHKLAGVDLGLIAEVAGATVFVHCKPNVGVLATGNELVEAGTKLGPAQIRNSNGPMLCGLVQQLGGTAMDLGIGRDDPDALRRRIVDGLDCDMLLLSGGVSTGDLDLVPKVLADLGVTQRFHKVRLRPGKPIWFGTCEVDERVVPVFGLPGNPVSSFVCFWLFVRPALMRLMDRRWQPQRMQRVQLATDFRQRSHRETYFPGRIVRSVTDSPTVTVDLRKDIPMVSPLPWKGSADLLTVTQADCLIRFPEGSDRFEAGRMVDAIPLRTEHPLGTNDGTS